MGKDFDHNQGLVLARHRQRRLQGVPTLSVLIGESEVARWCWTRWQGASALPFVCSEAATWAALLGDWLSNGPLHAELWRELMTRAAVREGVAREELEVRFRSHAEAQRQRVIEQLSARLGWSTPLISAISSEKAEPLADWVRAGYPASLSELASVSEVVMPGLLLSAPRAASAGELCELLGQLLRLSEVLPRLELACALSEAQLVRWRQEADARQLHLIKEGLIRLEPTPEDPELPRGVRRRRSGEHQRPTASDDEPGGAIPCLEYDADEFARSRAERALFEHLQARPRTQGLFALNGMIPEPFGTRPLEVDLLSEPLRVALEIDGYHHFRDAAAYRRDRDKDVLLQRLGYTVVRVLASDVEAELEYVTDTIDRVVEHQQRRRTE
jgi:very-short-patch-repair endonuclease